MGRDDGKGRLGPGAGRMAAILGACLVMALIEGVLKPGYGPKALCKLALFLGLPLAFSRLRAGAPLKALFTGWRRGLRLGLPLGLGVFLFILAAYHFIGPFFDFSAVTGALEQNMGVTPRNFVWVSLYIALVNSLLEEFFFRGFGFLCLRGEIGRRGAYLFSAGAFALYHVAIMTSWFSLPLFLLLIAALFVAGLLFNWLDERGGGLYPSWLVHIGANFAVNTVGFLLFGLL